VEFRILGRLEVVDGTRAIPVGGPRQRTVLAHLLLRANRPVSQEQLIDDVWGEDPPPAARSSLQSYVSHLRGALGPERLEGGSRGYILKLAPEELDAACFEALLREAGRLAAVDPTAAVHTYQEALSLWRGPTLDDLSGEQSLQPEIARLEELRLAAEEDRIAAVLDLGRHRELVPELETLVARHPLREELWGKLMVALYRSGRQAEALDAYRRARELLSEELGLDPSPELQRLQAQILRQDPTLELDGRPLRGYRLLERVGAGAFGEVHRAFQPDLEREVAVKVIRRGLANHPEFIRRFGVEAQLVARLEHPHIVPLYDYWREPDGAYIVMRYLRGGSLQEALRRGPLELDRAVSVLDQVSLALAAAHRQGVVHRDVKPGNILFDLDGNAYLSDFGIAKDLVAAESAGRSGTPSPLVYYLSPEEARGETVTARSDIYSLGVVLFESLAGRHPFADTPLDELLEKHALEPVPPIRSVRPELPQAIEEVIGRATAKDPDERYRDAVALAAALREALTLVAPSALAASLEARNPYKGLRPFVEADAGDFFGRDALVEELVGKLAEPGAESRFLAVVGPSGSGKSSLVHAGLVPALRQGALPGSDGWFVVDMHPGAQPFEELAAALARIAVDSAPGLVARLEEDDEGLLRAAGELLPADSEAVLVIDQFEEVFNLVDDDHRRTRFLAALVGAATGVASRLRVVITLRADFYDRPLSYPGLAELLKARTVTVTPLLPEELERAVSGPAERVGVNVDPALVADVAADVKAQPGALPLLQYALTELFDHRENAMLAQESYRRIGGVSGALARRAEDLYASLDEHGKEATRQLFLRLVTLAGEGGGADTRRRILRAELTSVDMDSAAMEAAMNAFGARRLLSFDRDPETRAPTVEVAHEALLGQWERLRSWIDERREDLVLHRRLVDAVREWDEAGRQSEYLPREGRLAQFESWAQTTDLAFTDEERDFLVEARASVDIAARRRARRRRGVLAGFASLALAASILAVFAFVQQGRAEREARTATSRELAAAAVANLDVDPERSILLALQAVDTTREAGGTVLREAEEALHRAVKSSRVVRRVPQGGIGLAISSDGRRFVTSGQDGTATVWDTETGKKLLELRGPGGPPAVALSPDDRLIVTTHQDGTVRLWDADTGKSLRVLRGHEGYATHPAFSPDGRLLATGGEDAAVRIWDVAAGTEEITIRGEWATLYPVFSPDGSRVAIKGKWPSTVRIRDLAEGKTVANLTGHEFGVEQVVFSPDGSRVATASDDGTTRIWDAQSGAQLLTLVSPGLVRAVEYSPDGTRVATGSGDGKARVWDAESGRELLTLAGHSNDVWRVAFTPDGDRLITAGLDNTTRIWDITPAGTRDWLTVPGAAGIFAGVTFSPDGSRFAAPAEPSGVAIWDAKTGDKIRTLTGYESKLTTVAFSPDGRRLAAGSDLTLTPPVWDVSTGELLFTLTGHGSRKTVRAVAFSPDGDRLVTGSEDGTAKLWDAETGKEQATIEPKAGPVYTVAFSPDGRFVLTGSQNGEVNVWTATTQKRVRALSGHADSVEGIAFGPNGMLVTASGDTTAKIWDLESGKERVTLRGHNAFVAQAAVSPDGSRVATTSDDGTTKLWDSATGRELLTLLGHKSLVFGVAFSPDGRLLATASPDGTVALHLLPIDEFRELARKRVTRSLTEAECQQYLHLDGCP